MIELHPERDLVRALNEKAFGPDRERPGRGGVKHVGGEDTDRMASLHHCWCGQVTDHGWPGKADGAPHPRETKVSP